MECQDTASGRAACKNWKNSTSILRVYQKQCSDVGVAFWQNWYTIIHPGREDGIDTQGVARILLSE